MLDYNRYVRNRESKKRVFWRCTKYYQKEIKCPGSVAINREDQPNSVQIRVTREHNSICEKKRLTIESERKMLKCWDEHMIEFLNEINQYINLNRFNSFNLPCTCLFATLYILELLLIRIFFITLIYRFLFFIFRKAKWTKSRIYYIEGWRSNSTHRSISLLQKLWRRNACILEMSRIFQIELSGFSGNNERTRCESSCTKWCAYSHEKEDYKKIDNKINDICIL